MTRLIGRIFNVHRGEGAMVLALLAFVFFIQTVLSAGKILQYSVFLDSFGRRSLSLAFLLAPLVLIVVTAVYSGLLHRVRRSFLLPGTLLFLAAGFVLWRLLLAPAPAPFPMPEPWQPAAVPSPIGPFSLYIWVEVAATIAIVQGWAYVTDVFDPRQAKRLIPLVGLGASFASLLNGFIVAPLVRHAVNAEELAWAVAGALCLAIVLFAAARRMGLGKTGRPQRPTRRKERLFATIRRDVAQIRSTPLLRIFAVLTVTLILSQGLLDFLFMNRLREQFDKNALASFYALFIGTLGTVQVVFQMFLSGRLIARFGSVACLAVLPLIGTVGGLTYLIVPLFGVLVALRFADRLTKQSFYSPSLSALYTPIPSGAKRQSMTLLKGMLSPLVFAAFGGLLLVAGNALPLQWLALALVAVSAYSAVVILRRARPAYIHALRQALERRRLAAFDLPEEFTVPLDGETLATIRAAVFDEQDEGKAVFALHLLRGVRSTPVRALLREALSHPIPGVRQEASRLLAELGDPAEVEAVVQALAAEADPEVAAVHLCTLATLGTEESHEAVHAQMDRPEAQVRLAALAAARTLGSSDPSLQRRIAEVIEAPEPAARQRLAEVIERFAQPALVPWCARLLEDEDPDVRRAALRAAAALRAPALLEPVLACFLERGPQDEAGSALAALGDAAVPALGRIAADPQLPMSLRIRVPKLLASVDTDAAGAVLESLLCDPAADLRYYAIRSLARITHNPGGYGAPPRALLLERVRQEAAQAHWIESVRRGLSARLDPTQSSLLYRELGHRMDRALQRIFGLVSMLEDPRTTSIVLFNLRRGTPRLRAAAIELMDTAFSRPVAALTLPLVESSGRLAETERAFPGWSERLRRARQDPIAAVMIDGDPWLQACAASAFGAAVAAHPTPLSPEVEAMLPTIERILFLQSVPLFRELSGEELHVIAGIAEQISVAQGEVICQQGDPGDAMFIVMHGSVSIQVAGTEIVTLGPREVVGELAVLDNLPRSADAIAAEDTDLLRIDGQSFDELLQDKPEIVKGIFRVLTARIRQSTARRSTDPERPVVAPDNEAHL